MFFTPLPAHEKNFWIRSWLIIYLPSYYTPHPCILRHLNVLINETITTKKYIYLMGVMRLDEIPFYLYNKSNVFGRVSYNVFERV